MNMKTLVLTIGATGVISAAAVAQLPSMDSAIAQGEAPSFEQIDANMDGNITTREAEGTWLAGSFATVDANKDGLVDEKEYTQAIS
ncbi:MAG: hypothetical protein AB8B57_07910 [Congregibacter sp.]